MIRQRRSSQKPGDDLLANFRQQFPEVSTVGTTTIVQPDGSTAAVDGAALHERDQSLPHEAFRDQDPTPRASNEPWRFTPSLLEANNFPFSNFSHNGAGAYYPPTPGGTNTIFHPQAGGQHTPTMGMGVGLDPSLSLPTDDGAIANATAAGMMPFAPFQQVPIPHFNGYAHPQQGFAPSTFVHPDTGYETMDQDGSPANGNEPSDDRIPAMDGASFQQNINPLVGMNPGPGYQGMHRMAVPLPPSAEKFRWHTTLNAPTAMIKHSDEIPITYLNKGQAYSLSIFDTGAALPLAPGTRYRTFVRVSFEDERQRQKPATCWSLWKEGRGTNEAHQRGGRLQAVEFVEAKDPVGDGSSGGDDKRAKVELESSSFDGFSVIWTPGISGVAEVNIAVRFNFLSTDFSHSKGVKGIPVRLCAKTSVYPVDLATVTTAKPSGDEVPMAEVCFCKAKLFRDHGAERKLSNDIAHVKKTIEKLKQQISQVESGMKDFGKRKRGGGGNSGAAGANGGVNGTSKGMDPQRPGKVLKHKRTWSMSSTSSGGATRKPPAEDDWHVKLQSLQDMFTSTRPVSVLFLRGEDLDDPDLHPVTLPGEQPGGEVMAKFEGGPAWQGRSGRSSVASSSFVSPSTRSPSLASASGTWAHEESDAGSGAPRRVRRTNYGGNLSGWIEALGVDPGYRPPPPVEREAKPVACFYVVQQQQRREGPEAGGDPAGARKGPYRAIYLARRTAAEFRSRVAAKWDVDPGLILGMTRVTPGGVEVEMDDDVVGEVPEEQDMVLEVVQRGAGQVKSEWEMMIDTVEEVEGGQAQQQRQDKGRGYELRFHF